MAAEVFLALDVGDARIGVALSRSGVIAEPVGTIERIGRRQTLAAVAEWVERERVTTCVIGLPLLAGGAEGEQAEKSHAFARSLQRRLPSLAIVMHDERWSSAEARAMGDGRAMARYGEDAVAAMVILQGYLDNRTK